MLIAFYFMLQLLAPSAAVTHTLSDTNPANDTVQHQAPAHARRRGRRRRRHARHATQPTQSTTAQPTRAAQPAARAVLPEIQLEAGQPHTTRKPSPPPPRKDKPKRDNP